MWTAICELLAAAGKLILQRWMKKNNPTVAQRDDQIAKDYDDKRKDLDGR